MSEAPGRRNWSVTNPQGGIATISGLDFGGSGPLAILSHANGFCAATWSLVAPRLTARYHVVALDARGHGDSDPPPVLDDALWDLFVSDLTSVALQLLEETGESRVAYGIGNSMGGIVTAVAEARHPGLFERIAMLDPPIHPTPALISALGLALETEPGNRKESLVDLTRRRRAVWPSREAAREAWRDKPMFAAMKEAAFEQYLQEGLTEQADGQVALKCDPLVEAHVFLTTGGLDFLDYGPKVAAPVLLVHAEKGHLPQPLFRALVKLFPRGTLEEVPCGHLLPMEAPALTAGILLEFAEV